MTRLAATPVKERPCAPVTLMVFNRPDMTRRLLERIRQVRPGRLLVVADGPRATVPSDVAACEAVRNVIRAGVDWDARLDWNVAESNLGVRRRVSSGLHWAFELEPESIVLEDDCLPHPTFFRFCTELLERYREDTRIGHISGDNFQQGPPLNSGSYYFSRYNHVWGWASWRRAWVHYDEAMAAWPRLRDSGWLASLFSHPLEAAYWEHLFEEVHAHRIGTWDYQWLFTLWTQHQLSILPARNLVTNIGVGETATHTRDADPAKHQLATVPMEFPLVHPPMMVRDHRADDYSQSTHFGRAKDQSVLGRIRRLGGRIRRLPRRLGRPESDEGATP